MPQYEYFCQTCKKAFPKVMTLDQYKEGDILCPYCGSDDVEQSWSAFYAITSRKSA
jgi:putative FmdB family regulatory protein